MNMRNPIARAMGHGSAKAGVHHWYAQRASAVLLIFLAAWMVYAVLSLAGGGYAASREFIANPVNASFLCLALIVMLYHAMLGLQVVIEDYVHQPAAEIVLHFLVRAGAWFGMALGIIQLLKIALGA